MSGTLTSCWTCARSGPSAGECRGLGVDAKRRDIAAWCDESDVRSDGTVPRTATGCPGWMPREGVAAPEPPPAWVPAPTEAGWWVGMPRQERSNILYPSLWRVYPDGELMNAAGLPASDYPPGTVFLRIPDPPLEAP